MSLPSSPTSNDSNLHVMQWFLPRDLNCLFLGEDMRTNRHGTLAHRGRLMLGGMGLLMTTHIHPHLIVSQENAVMQSQPQGSPRILGHATIAITMDIYVNADHAMLRTAMELGEPTYK